MILGAALLVLVALALFVGGIVTGTTALYWSCVALSVVAAVLLVLARRELGRPVAPDPEPDEARDQRQDAVAAGRGAEATSGRTSGPDGTAARRSAEPTVEHDDDEAPAEEVEVTDLLLVMDLHDEVVVVDEHPRYHLADCSWLRGRTPIPLPVDEARTDGFTPCGLCAPDRHLAEAERERRNGTGRS